MAKVNLEFIQTKELGTIDGGLDVILGHYTDGEKIYADKIYIFESYSKKDGTTITKSVGKFTPKQLQDLQNIDIFDIDVDFNANEAFD